MEVDKDNDVNVVLVEDAINQNCAGAPARNENKKLKFSKRTSPKKNTSQPQQRLLEACKAFNQFMQNRNTQSKEREVEGVAPVAYQPGCGLHCASRGPHRHFQNNEVFDFPLQQTHCVLLNLR